MKRQLTGIFVCWFLVCATTGAWAANDGRADPDLLIDRLETFADLSAARHECRDAKVVWADYTGFFYECSEPQYGTTRDGDNACEPDAKKARYWGTDPGASMDGHPGRTFPFDPIVHAS